MKKSRDELVSLTNNNGQTGLNIKFIKGVLKIVNLAALFLRPKLGVRRKARLELKVFGGAKSFSPTPLRNVHRL